MAKLTKGQPQKSHLDNFLLFHHRLHPEFPGDEYSRDYCQVIIFLSGKMTYRVDGRVYPLQPWDILLLTENDLVKVEWNPADLDYYQICFKPAYLLKNSLPGNNLLTCFEQASALQRNLLRFEGENLNCFRHCLISLENAEGSNEFGSKISRNAYFLLLIVMLNRFFATGINESYEKDAAIERVIEYIDTHLGEDLLIERLAEQFGFSKYNLMHKFKRQTGFAVHHYILQKRLRTINALITKGYPFMEASVRCGFTDYSCFVRAFTKYYGLSPRKYYERMRKGH